LERCWSPCCRRPNSGFIRGLALFHAGLALILSWSLLAQFDRSTAAIQFVEQVVWSSTIGVSYALGRRWVSLPMVLLTTLLVRSGAAGLGRG
jgi:NADH-quinone oxidoreductase subunit M